jgi:hypothetical protein
MQRKIDDELLAVSAAPTEAPTMARAVGSRTAWRSRGAAIGVIALALSLAACGGSSSNDDPPGDPVVVDPDPVNPDPVNPDPVDPDPVDPDPVPVDPPTPADPKPAGFTKTGDVLTVAGSTDVGDRFTSDADPQRVISYDPVTQKYYEFVALVPPALITWPDARAAAAVKGGDLAVLETPEDMLFVNRAYDGLGGVEGTDGTWVGASQAAGATEKGEGWTWIDQTALPGNSPLWNLSAAFGQLPLDSSTTLPEGGRAQYGAIYDGLNVDDTKLLYDHGATDTGTNPKYLIEYANKEAIK